jgi:hypothetical protein
MCCKSHFVSRSYCGIAWDNPHPEHRPYTYTRLRTHVRIRDHIKVSIITSGLNRHTYAPLEPTRPQKESGSYLLITIFPHSGSCWVSLAYPLFPLSPFVPPDSFELTRPRQTV